MILLSEFPNAVILYMKNIRVVLALVLLCSVFASPVNAHHGWSFYAGEALEVKGILVEKHFQNPHDYLTIIVDGQYWIAYLGPPSRNLRAGLSEDSIQVGDEITIYGHQHNDPAKHEMKTERVWAGDRYFNFYPERE